MKEGLKVIFQGQRGLFSGMALFREEHDRFRWEDVIYNNQST